MRYKPNIGIHVFLVISFIFVYLNGAVVSVVTAGIPAKT